ncbi:MAG TPA: hypothetical protein VGM31_04220 [Puia sp.]|jgi:hypothetical protein
MIDLTLFHEQPDKNYPTADNLNSRTGPLACYLLEWFGWYNYDVAHRLLGHYRLFQLFKKDPDHAFRHMPLSQAYILHYRSSHVVKYFISRATSLFYCIFTGGRHYLAVEIEAFNHSLIHDHAPVLREFLDSADIDFTAAFNRAMNRLRGIMQDCPEGNTTTSTIVLSQINLHHTTVSTDTQTNPSPAPPLLTGKAKGVFSKKQILMFFDLLAQAAHIEKIDFTKPNKYAALARLLHALTGKGISSWLQQLNDHRHKDLYKFHTEGERKQLVASLINMAELFRAAGFRSIAAQADKKNLELEHYRKDE